MKNILYITRNGLLEPLGQSQILSYLCLLSKTHQFHIISFEKQKQIRNEAHLKEIQSICERNNIQWTPLVYFENGRLWSVIKGFFQLIKLCIKLIKHDSVDFIHARSCFPAFVALLMYKIFRTPFVFDMRALWPEELVQAGRLKENSMSWKLIKFLEKKCLKKSFAIVSLTHAALDYLHKVYPDFLIKEKTIVIPTCANLNRFSLKNRKFSEDCITISCIGSMLSGWFKIDVLKAMIDYMLSNYSNIKFEFLTRDSKEKLLLKIDPKNKWINRIHVESVLFKDMPKRLVKHDGSVFFFTPNISKLGSSPTRMAEILAVGIPVLTNPGVGDVSNIVEEFGVGELLNSLDPKEVKISCDNFMKLMQKQNIAQTCRKTAENLFSLESGVNKYHQVYNLLPIN